MDSIGQRLAEERRRLGKNQTDFAELAGLKKGAQINYEKGVRSPDATYLAAIANHGVDVDYVLTGKATQSRLEPDELLLLQTYRSLDKAGKTAALGAMVGIGQASGSVTQNFHSSVKQAAGRDVLNVEKKESDFHGQYAWRSALS